MPTTSTVVEAVVDFVYYSRVRLIVFAILSIALAVVCMLPFLDMNARMPGAAGVLFGGWFGHLVVSPIVVLCSVIVAWRLAMMAAGDLQALAVDHSGVRVTTLWRTTDIPWRDLILARLIVARSRYGKRYSFCFDRRSGSSVRLPVALTTLHVDQYHDVIRALGERQYQESRRPAGPPASSPPPVAPVAAAPAPVRGFGRKGVPG